MAAPNENQVELAVELQELLLKELRARIEAGEATSTDLATLSRLLMQNGWTLDPADLPQDLRNHITNEVEFDEDLDEEDALKVVG